MSRPDEQTAAPSSPAPEAPASAPAAEAPDAALAAARQEAAANYDRFLRVSADLENFRRRAVREKEELRLFAASRVIEELLPVLDNLALGLAAGRKEGADPKSVLGGVELVLQQLKSALTGHGLKELAPAAGQAFNPHEHEAIAHQPSAEVAAEQVLSLVRPGYSLQGRLLRPASVVVSSGPQA